ncbi:MAG TPA: chorismate synthase [Pyrodictium sp.]|nr:chorismate synthase [Pyrodictium sp.]
MLMGFGRLFRVTLFGESHGKLVGVVVEGVPPGLKVSLDELNEELRRRRPGGKLVSSRRELDQAEIVSGVYKGYTTGAPITIIVYNRDVDSSFYEKIVRFKPRPGHADFGARLHSMGFEDYRGGGFHSGRITVGLVAAGYLARKILETLGVSVAGLLRVLGGIECRYNEVPIDRDKVYVSPVRCPDPQSSKRMIEVLEEVASSGDSVGGIIEVHGYGVPKGLGEPHSHSLDADIAYAMFMVPGVKGVETGLGFKLAYMRGSEVEESIRASEGNVDGMGGSGFIWGGYSVSSTIVVRVAIRPTATIGKPRKTIDWRTLEESEIVGSGRHDPAIAVRAVPVIESVLAIVLADHILSWLGWRLAHYYNLERGYERL